MEKLSFDRAFPMPDTDSARPAAFQRLRQLKPLLLRLHKALMEMERGQYEQAYGPIRSSGEYFQLVTTHEWFEWLRPISQFIIKIDDCLSPRTSATLTDAIVLLTEARSLLTPDEAGSLIAQRYYDAIQRFPDIALLHADVSGILTDP